MNNMHINWKKCIAATKRYFCPVVSAMCGRDQQAGPRPSRRFRVFAKRDVTRCTTCSVIVASQYQQSVDASLRATSTTGLTVELELPRRARRAVSAVRVISGASHADGRTAGASQATLIDDVYLGYSNKTHPSTAQHPFSRPASSRRITLGPDIFPPDVVPPGTFLSPATYSP